MTTTIKGVALTPTVSKNNRMYTAEAIRRMVSRAQARIRSGPPITMLSHHAAEDDSLRICGRLTKMSVGPGGEALFEGELADTAAGRDIAALVDKRRFLDGVSIRGYWVGPVSKVTGPSGPVECGSDLALDGLDFTRSPGVDGARLTESAPGTGRIIRESVGETDEQMVERLVEAQLRVLREASRPGALAELSPQELTKLAGMAFLRPAVAETAGAGTGGDPGWTELTESQLRSLDAETFRQYSSGLLAHRQQQLESRHQPSPFNAPGGLRSPFWRTVTGG